jgi:hypothetical protein
VELQCEGGGDVVRWRRDRAVVGVFVGQHQPPVPDADLSMPDSTVRIDVPLALFDRIEDVDVPVDRISASSRTGVRREISRGRCGPTADLIR